MPKLTLIIPVYNEELQLKNKLAELENLKSLLQNDLEIIIIDSNSTDSSSIYFDLLKSKGLAKVLFLDNEKQQRKSIGLAVTEACQKAECDLIVVWPVDILITKDHLQNILDKSKTESLWGCFTKKYDSQSSIMTFYGYLQNQLLTRYLRQGVWTNVFFFNKKLSDLIPIDGFLEDVLFCDRLRKVSLGHVIDRPVLVNIRKYNKDGINRRIASNGIIVLLYRFGYRDIPILKDFYVGKINFYQLLKKICLEN